VAAYFGDSQFRIMEAVCDRLIPTDHDPGAREARVVEYIDGFLGAFAYDPPRIWAGGAFSGRFGGSPGFASFYRLSALDELAWRTRIEGSLGMTEREWNGPVVGLQERYAAGLAALGEDFADVDGDEQDRRLRDCEEFRELVYEHACEGMYGAPEYGGNRGGVGWAYIDFAGDVQPRGYTDEEVSQP
jgi:hypothetical protein